MLRILIIAPTMYFSDRGCHIRIYEEARELRRRGHEATILTYHSGKDAGDVPVRRIWRTPWYDKLTAGPSLHFLYMDALLFLRTLKFVRNNEVDLIHAHLHEGAFIADRVTRLTGSDDVPYLFDAQGSLTGEMVSHGFIGPGGPTYGFWRRIERGIVRRSPRIVTSSSPLKETMVREFGADRERVSSVPDGVDVKKFVPRKDRPDRQRTSAGLRGKIGIPPDETVVVYLGGMDRHKGVYYLIEAAVPVLNVVKRKGWRGVHFLLMGYPGKEGVEAEVKRSGLEEHVTVLGKIPYDEAPEYLALGDMAVAPKELTWGEANGKLLNYMGCGLPVVTFEHGTNREILGSSGVYAKMGDSDDLARKILDLARYNEKREWLGAELRGRAVKEFTWERAMDRIEEVYSVLLSE